jgi:hypothetical protein
MPSFKVQTDQVAIVPLDAEASLEASTRVFWNSRGFAFQRPGAYRVEVRIIWTYGGLHFGVRSAVEAWVNYPQLAADNQAAATLRHPEVGMYVALGGGATHLTEAVARLERVAGARAAGDEAAPAALRGYADLLPPAAPATGGGTERKRGRTSRKARR